MATLSGRLEIAFWIGWVAALRLVRLIRWASLLLVMTTCFLALLFVRASASYLERNDVFPGVNAGDPASGKAQNAAEVGPVVLPTADRSVTEQLNVLFLLVDRLGGVSPHLQGAWLVVSDPQGQGLTFLPLYPSLAAAQAPASADLKRDFRLDFSGAPGRDFLRAISQKGVWWHHYLVLDHASLAALVELVGGAALGNGMLNGAQAVATLPASGQAPGAVLEGQAMLLDAICRQSAGLFKSAHPDLIAGLLTGSGRSDVGPEAFEQGWAYLSRSGELTCEFPTVLGR